MQFLYNIRNGIFLIATLSALLISQLVYAEEVEKGHIPADHLEKSLKKLPWGVAIWDNAEAIEHLNKAEGVLWVDTRPPQFFTSGTIRNAVNLPFNQSGKAGNDLTAETLEKALMSANLDKNSALIVFFCQGPECHRSYNSALVAVAQWGYAPKQIVWYRDGYPNLFSEIKDNTKLKRRAKKIPVRQWRQTTLMHCF